MAARRARRVPPRPPRNATRARADELPTHARTARHGDAALLAGRARCGARFRAFAALRGASAAAGRERGAPTSARAGVARRARRWRRAGGRYAKTERASRPRRSVNTPTRTRAFSQPSEFERTNDGRRRAAPPCARGARTRVTSSVISPITTTVVSLPLLPGRGPLDAEDEASPPYPSSLSMALCASSLLTKLTNANPRLSPSPC